MSKYLRSDVGYGILGCFLTEVDETKGVDDILHDIHTDDCNCMPYTELAQEISPVNLYCLIHKLIDSVVREVERQK